MDDDFTTPDDGRNGDTRSGRISRPFLDTARTAPLLPRMVVAATAERYGLTADDVRGRDRHRRTARARHHAAFSLREDCDLSWPEIGRQLGIDHTSAMVGAKRFARACGLVAWKG